ncbi:unnamed protein product [Leptidea sinapis]|uniref:Ciliogenesis-associated TTC17-interacting protein N-terminal domain-containing protein n=1 Tax=Leptidea sinapis TaxID=189913 RepID=A0A5E4PY17_9NEOP|nr:unnamed protein product [Leptidea sinapis]
MASPRISLIDLSKHFYFNIDEKTKKELCFAETLIISCGHIEGDIRDDESSDWTCEESDSRQSVELKHDEYIKVKEPIEEEPGDVQDGEDNDFQFYFFPDCTKPLPSANSKDSVIIEDGMPKLNPAIRNNNMDFCTCEVDKNGECPCIIKIPCLCGAKTRHTCKCIKVESLCICDVYNPQLVCTCKSSELCLCHSDGKPRPKCTCEEIKKPCICATDKFPFPVCPCETKPTLINTHMEVIYDECGEVIEEESVGEQVEEPIVEPCLCQKSGPKPPCHCGKGDECTCSFVCICHIRRPCECEPKDGQDPACKDAEEKSICSCPASPVCSCVDTCDCEPKEKVCTCEDPDNCNCMKICDCTEPCLCDIQKEKDENIFCTCPENKTIIGGGIVCTCPKKDDGRKLKRVQGPGEQGYRWCHDVDPRHTYFDFGYGRHDKISYKEPPVEKIKILGLHEHEELQSNVDVCPVHSIEAPQYIKKVRKASLDCCSTVGGISFSVEMLGEDGNKFLVQVVSHSSKEGAKSSSKLVSILDCNLHTLEENRSEQITKRHLTKERRSYMTISESGYYNKVTRICGERHIVKRIYHSFEEAHDFLLEGANVVLLRYFALSRYKGKLKSDTVLIDGMICESVYAIVNGTPLYVVKVERHIIEPTGFVHQTLTVLTLKDNEFMIHLNPLLRVVPERDEIERHEPTREKWRSDLQLFSDYLDFKSTRSSDGARYVTENGELAATIRDYLQTLLLLRPSDALHFTRHYFGSALSALDLPHSEYFDPCSKHVRYFYFEE